MKNPPASAEDTGSILGQDQPLEKGMATYSSILAWKISWTEEPGGPQSMGLQRVRQDCTDTQRVNSISLKENVL